MRTSQALAAALLALIGLARPCRASVASGGPWDLIRSQDGYSARVSTAADIELSYSLGEPYIALSSVTAGSVGIRTGYLSQLPSLSSAATSAALPPAAAAGVVLSGQIMNGISAAVPLAFADEMATATVASGGRISAILDSMANTTSVSHPFSVSYSTITKVYSILPAGGPWPKGTLFQVVLTTSVLDVNGLPLAAVTTYYFSTNRDFTAQNVVSLGNDPGIQVKIPPNAFTADYFLVVSSGIQSGAVTAADAALAGLGKGYAVVKTVKLDPYSGTAQPWTAGLAGDITLALPFNKSGANVLVQGSNAVLPASTLEIWSLDETRNLWVRQPGSIVDAANNQVLVAMNHFTIDAAIAALSTDVDATYAFPVPFRPNAGNVARFGSWATGITFTNLPSAGMIRIYTVSGVLVRELSILSNPQVWDVRNSQGQNAASGLYIWEVQSSGSNNRKTGKLAIIQ